MKQDDLRSVLENATSTEKVGRGLRFFREAWAITMVGLGLLAAVAWIVLLGWLLYRAVLLWLG
jgi:flagellar biogenesis protein FliO